MGAHTRLLFVTLALAIAAAFTPSSHAQCTALDIGTGNFVPITPWSIALSQTSGGVTVTRNAGGPNPGISVTGPTGTMPYHPTLGSSVSKFLMFGSPPRVLILESGTGVASVNRNVSIVDFTGASPTEQPIFLSSSTSTAINEPVVHRSPNSGAFLIWSNSGTQLHNMAIRRSDTGDVIGTCSVIPFMSTGATFAVATATELEIHYHSGGSPHTQPCSKPLGECDVSPNSHTFPDAVVGGAAGLASTTEVFTIQNDGDDCLTINSIGDVSPFSVTSTSISLPNAVLGPGDTMTVEVTFAPAAIGNFGPVNLPVTRTPANGDNALVCSGEGRAPVIDIDFSPASVSFDTVPVASPATRSLNMINDGETDLNVSVPVPGGASPFQWDEFNDVIAYANDESISITFTPPVEGPFAASMTVNSDDPASPHSISITGEGCIANGEITPPSTAPKDFGEIQQGFRTVRYITINNPGDGPLTFDARIAGADASLFGLQPPSGSVYDVLSMRPYTVDPVSPCGPIPSGTGETIVAVAFWANDLPDTTAKTADLIIENHIATNTVTTSWTIPLSAVIVEPIPVDAVEVLDRSGSMGDPSGDRIKSEAEISAGRLFIQLARPDILDRMAVVKFNETPEIVQAIDDITSGNQTAMANKINSTELNPTGATSIAGGVIVGLAELAKPRPIVPDQDINKIMVVLTDGMDNRAYQNPADSIWYSLLGGESIKPNGDTVDTDALSVPSDVKIYAIGLGNADNIDEGRLDVLAQTSGGYYGVVGDLSGKKYFDLEKYFTQIFMDTVGMSVIMDPVYTINPGEEHRIDFDVLRGDVGAMIVFFDREGRLPFHLESPKGELIDASFVPVGFQLRSGATDTARFLEFRVPQGEPDRYAGRWSVVVRHTGQVCFGDPTQHGQDPIGAAPVGGSGEWGFLPRDCRPTDDPVDYGIAIGAGSNFRLQAYVTPGVVHVGDPILLTGVLSEVGLPVIGSTVTVRAESPSGTIWNFTLLDDGAHDDMDPDDGEYGRQFIHTAEAGSYEFTFRAEGYTRDGEPVVREAVRAKYVEGDGGGTVRPDPGRPGTGQLDPDRPGSIIEKCCKLLAWLLVVVIIVLLLIALILWLRRG